MEAVDRLLRAAAAERDEELASHAGDLVRRRLTVTPAERTGGHLERGRVFLGESVLLVAEDRGREQVQEAVLVAAANGVVEPGSRLERDLEAPASLDELGERRGRSAAPSRRSAPSRGAPARRSGGRETRRRAGAAARSRPRAPRRRAPRDRSPPPRSPRSSRRPPGAGPCRSRSRGAAARLRAPPASMPDRRSGSRSSRRGSP